MVYAIAGGCMLMVSAVVWAVWSAAVSWPMVVITAGSVLFVALVWSDCRLGLRPLLSSRPRAGGRER